MVLLLVDAGWLGTLCIIREESLNSSYGGLGFDDGL